MMISPTTTITQWLFIPICPFLYHIRVKPAMTPLKSIFMKSKKKIELQHAPLMIQKIAARTIMIAALNTTILCIHIYVGDILATSCIVGSRFILVILK